MAENLPPHNKEIEQALLGAMLRDNAVIAEAAEIVETDDFYLDAHRKIHRAIVDVYQKTRTVDAVILADRLKELSQVDDVGGYSYLGELLQEAPTGGGAMYHAQQVRSYAVFRHLGHVGRQIAHLGECPSMSSEDAVTAAEALVNEVGQRQHQGGAVKLAVAVNEAMGRIDARDDHEDEVSPWAVGRRRQRDGPRHWRLEKAGL